ncbi:4-(cytidine 5'-diphospho)-2-C-methyl-D-erythritol kinase [Leeia sp. TBRC 13508]|uniref:4-diphosphocytidyl-2-C-methyl-D-erythritol kinase n=1 Tax=Leeia speluncae TaxID=2884804 RepID=A0ABS8D2X6_9NEIS|nr:4-(cytidine 5'-diphospho)-2-C-methyl-D-erythritol kinase [Leeia speluncae]MCB6182517.1 4-(cytidine 5'-diphospho)-2-C-methyl-D-erythritol kinase [Leeia speluncae]
MHHIFPSPAKINLFLHVTGRRDDGYHLLQTAFTFIDLIDEVKINVREDGQLLSSQPLDGIPFENDLCYKAALLLKTYTGSTLGADIAVNKNIPMGGGLGGGSSNAATVLIALNLLWNTNLDNETLQRLGLQLGADVPIFIFGHSAFAEGIGEKLQKIEVPEKYYLLAMPQVNVPTVEIFKDPLLTRDTPTIIMPDFRECTQQSLKNDLQPIACKQFKEVAEAVELLSQFGKAIMTGSGACVFVEFDDQQTAESAKKILPKHLPSKVVRGYNSHPLHSMAKTA